MHMLARSGHVLCHDRSVWVATDTIVYLKQIFSHSDMTRGGDKALGYFPTTRDRTLDLIQETNETLLWLRQIVIGPVRVMMDCIHV